MEGSSDPAFVPEAEWSRVVDDAKSRNRRQQKGRAQKKKDVRCSRFRNAQENQGVAGREEHGRCQSEHPNAREQACGILGPAAGSVVLSKKPKPVRDQCCNDSEVRDCGDPVLQVHPSG